MTECKEYTGSDDQIEEMWNAADGYILRFSDKVNDRIRKAKEAWLTEQDFYNHCKKVKNVTHYLICNPHPNADMICKQALTGIQVYIKESRTKCLCKEEFVEGDSYATTKPNWNIPGAQYSFTPFEDK